MLGCLTSLNTLVRDGVDPCLEVWQEPGLTLWTVGTAKPGEAAASKPVFLACQGYGRERRVDVDVLSFVFGKFCAGEALVCGSTKEAELDFNSLTLYPDELGPAQPSKVDRSTWLFAPL